MENSREEKFMNIAIELSKRGISGNSGGPFGAVVVKGDKILGKGFNQVASKKDPTAHAEIMAIRAACAKLRTFDLSDCQMYTSCEPCPMCLGAIYWAKINQIYYGNSRENAASIGFDDHFIYKQMCGIPENRSLSMIQISQEQAFAIFKLWNIKPNKVVY